MMNLYQQAAMTTVLTTAWNRDYLLSGLAGEVGELMSIYAKHIRDNSPLNKDAICKELGDILWFIAVLAKYEGFNLDEVARCNIDKLQSRKMRCVLGGSGDDR